MMYNNNNKYGLKKSLNCTSSEQGILIGTNPIDTLLIEINELWIKDLILLLDGTQSILDIQSQLKQKGYQLEKENILEKIKLFFDNDLLDDYNSNDNQDIHTALNENEIERYDRQMLLFKSIAGDDKGALSNQVKLKNSKICLIGIGGIGSYVFYALAAMGVGEIKVVDFDKVELSNLSRQILYTEDDIDHYKIDVARKKSELINSNVKYEFINDMITDTQRACEIIKDSDLVILCADIPRGKIGGIINKAAFELKVPVIYGGSARTCITCGPIIIPGETECYACFFDLDKKTTNSKDDDIVQFIRNRYTTTLIDPYNSMAGSLISLEAVKLLTNFQASRLKGEMMILDTDDYSISKIKGEAKASCNICGQGEEQKVYKLFN